MQRSTYLLLLFGSLSLFATLPSRAQYQVLSEEKEENMAQPKSTTSDSIDIKGGLCEPGFSVKFMDAALCADGGQIFCGRFDRGDYDQYLALYKFDHNLHPAYIQKGFFHGAVSIVHRTNAARDSMWTMLYPYCTQASAINASHDGGWLIAGFNPTERAEAYKGDRSQAPTLLKIDANGKALWFKIFNTEYNSVAFDVLTLNNGDIFLLADREYAPVGELLLNPSKLRLLKLNSKGDIIWEKTLPGAENELEQSYIPSKLLLDKAGNIMLLGTNQSTNATYLAQLDTSGQMLQWKEYRWPLQSKGKEWNWGFSVVSAKDGWIFSASAYSAKEKIQHIAKVDKNLNIVWEQTPNADPIDESRLLVNEAEEVYFAGNSTNGLLVVAKYDANGKLCWEKEVPSSRLFSIGQLLWTEAGTLMVVGSQHTYGISDWQGVFYCLDAAGNLIPKK